MILPYKINNIYVLLFKRNWIVNEVIERDECYDIYISASPRIISAWNLYRLDKQ